jgi:hypothetical protein
VFGVKTVADLTVPELEAMLERYSLSAKKAESEKADEAEDVKPAGEDGPASDTELLFLQRQINQLRS